MNFLAHLWLAHRSDTSLAGAILGDVVRGSDLSSYPDDIATGIRLHRRIDAATDRHPLIVELRSGFEDGTRRYAGILLDLVCDHALALDWAHYETESLAMFCRRVSQPLADAGRWFVQAGGRASDAAGFERLLLSYAEPAGIDRAIARTAQRMRRPEALLQIGMQWTGSLAAVRRLLPQLLDDLQRVAAAGGAH